MIGIIGKKLGMTQIFNEEGQQIPCTVVEATPNSVIKVLTKDKVGFDSVELGFGEQPVMIGVDVDPVDLRPRRHHLAHRAIGKADDTRYDGALAFLDDARFRRFGKDQVEFFGSNMAVRFAAEAEQPKDQCTGAVEYPDDRGRRLRQP